MRYWSSNSVCLLRFFLNLLCSINFRFAVVGLECIQKSTGNRVNSPCDVTAMQWFKKIIIANFNAAILKRIKVGYALVWLLITWLTRRYVGASCVALNFAQGPGVSSCVRCVKSVCVCVCVRACVRACVCQIYAGAMNSWIFHSMAFCFGYCNQSLVRINPVTFSHMLDNARRWLRCVQCVRKILRNACA